MSTIQIEVTKVVTLISILFLMVNCHDEHIKSHNNNKEYVDSLTHLIVNVVDVAIENGTSNIKIDVENISNEDYLMVYSFKGDLDQREFPAIIKENNSITIEYFPFSSKIIDAFIKEHEGEYSPPIHNDDMGLQLFRSNQKRSVTFNIEFDSNNINTRKLILYFAKPPVEAFKKHELHYITPSKNMMELFSFNKKEVFF
ncbi:hypothetical protein R9C00_09590 [Flammeovirgaceae bacterium SG7u.111]|nr:hypothetical protein [Flammeovirgaceae bacterium SG7u.132]WPO37702.1 hypothetical protein R9C00_09590 [Flammeovirgaceae bacterium SG7u.111]